MNRKVVLLGVVAWGLGSVSLHAARVFGRQSFVNAQRSGDDLSVFGETDIDRGSFESLIVRGRLRANDLTVTNDISVSGEFDGKHISCHSLSCTGRTTITGLQSHDCDVTGELDLVQGTVKTKISTMGRTKLAGVTAQDFVFKGTEAYLNNCTLDRIEVKSNKNHYSFWGWVKSWWSEDDSASDPQDLYLSGKTHIAGDVVFRGGKGTAHLCDASNIHGQVIGGVIKK
jgi:hypothetical protein